MMVEHFQGGGSMSFEECVKNVDDFLELLKAKGIDLVTGGPLERACYVALELGHQRQHLDDNAPWEDLRDDLQVAVGLLAIVHRLIERQNHPCFSALLPHLRLLAATTNSNPSPAARASVTDDVANKIVELSLGVGACGLSDNVEMDDPVHSSGGANPDVLFTTRRGQRWGIACKAVHGEAPMTLFDLMVDGVRQIENARCDTGIVFVTLKNRLPHGEYLPELESELGGYPVLGAHRDSVVLRERLGRFALDRIYGMVRHVTKEAVWKELRGKKAIPGLMVVAPTTAIIKTASGPMIAQVAQVKIVEMEYSPIYLPTRLDRDTQNVLLSLLDNMM